MANRRVLVKRRKAARNIRKITRTMQLIATARFQAAYNRAMASKPYTRKLEQLVADLASSTEGLDHPLMRAPEEDEKGALLIISSTRGLCGGYNAHVLREALAHHTAHGGEIHAVGKKGIAYLRFVGRPATRELTGVDERPKFEEVEKIANEMMRRFAAAEIGSLDVAYMKFISTGRQQAVVERILPLSKEEVGAGGEAEAGPREPGHAGATVEYEFSPEPKELLAELLPATVRVRLYQCFTDAAVSEQVSRMVAMKAATDAAGDMIKRLTQQYNRARQTAITMELLDIVGGANALN